MKRLSQIISSVEILTFISPTDVEIIGLANHFFNVKRGVCYFAIPNGNRDGHAYIYDAIKGGAVAIVCERLPETINPKVSYVVVEDCYAALSKMAAEYYDNPSHQLKLVGVTGTNGKTTTATLLYGLLQKLGYKAGLISTVEHRVGDDIVRSYATTPNAIILNKLLRDMVDAGCAYCFMEVASHALVAKNVLGLKFQGAIFTNLTLDHLDFHKTFDNYKYAKKSFFDMLDSDAWAVTNLDDGNGMFMVQDTKAKVVCYSLQQMTDYRGNILQMGLNGMELCVNSNNIRTRLIGRFNAYNVLGVYSAAIALGLNSQDVLNSLSVLNPARGRLEIIGNSKGITAIVDYAHTPDALENVLKTIRELNSQQKVIVVCGCGGDRDKSKRPLMADIATRYASFAIFTSDNPRTEDPNDIIKDMLKGVCGVDNYLCISDRRKAICYAISMANCDDIVLVTGKGHEEYQIIKGNKIKFSDVEELKKALDN